MALTKVSPSLFQVSNNITSVTVGGSANTISLTFDSNGVITGASNNALSVANTLITGNIVSSQITSVANTQITGNITAAQITSVANTQLTGLIQAAQIGSANATLITSGTLPGARLPVGTVLQVVQANSITYGTTTSSTYQQSNLTVTITPTSSSSKVLVQVQTQIGLAVNNWSDIALYRNNTTNLSGATAGAGIYAGPSSGTFDGHGVGIITFLDSPATTSATTYTMFFRSRNNSGTVRVILDSMLSTITAMEIAG